MSNETALGKLIQRLRQYFQPVGITRRFTITNAKPAGKAQIVIGTIGEGRNALPGQTLDIGNADVYANGEVYEIQGTGDPNDPQWRFIRRLVARNPKRGADLFAALPAPVWSSIVNPDDGFANPIALGTEADLNANTGAVGEPFALLRAFYRVIVPGSYSCYKEHLQSIQLQYKAATADGWRNVPSQQITPSRPIRITLNEDLTSSETAVDIALPADVALAELHPGYYVHWRIDGEIVIGKIVSAVLLTILASGGRGAESTTAVTHSSGASIELLTGQAVATGLDPGVETQVRVAFVDGYGVDGPPSVVNVLTTWKRQTIPPLVDGDFLVDMRSNGFHLKWVRPLLDGVPMTAKLFYKVYRNTSASTSGAKVVLEKFTNFEADIPSTEWDTDATRKDANWFGIQVSDGFGNESAGTATNLIDGVLWAQDNVPPPHPTGVSFQSVPNGVAVHVDPAVDTTHTDPGFIGQGEFVLYTNAAGSGTTGTEVARSPSLDFIWQVYTLDSQTYYQLAAADGTGNQSTLLTGTWQFVASLYPTTDWPQNGNFQDPDPGLPAPGVAGSEPNHWSLTPANTNIGNQRYLASGGGEGNRVVAGDVAANIAGNPGGYLIQSDIQVLPSQKTPTLEVWIRVTQSLSGNQRFRLYCAVDGWANDDGTSTTGGYFFQSTDLTLTANTWTKVTIAMSPISSSMATARTGNLDLGIGWYLTNPATNPAFTIYMDSARIIWT